MDRAVLLNAFLPASGVEDPHRFAGRRDEIEELANALVTKGSVPLIYGHRGLGKSSLALQLSRIAQGDTELLSELDLSDLVLKPAQQFIALYVNCSDSTKNLDGMLQLMINAIDSMREQRFRDQSKGDHRLVDKTTRRTLSFKIFSSETTKRYEAAKLEVDTSKFSKEERLIRLAEILTDVYQQPVLFILDEVDRVKNTRGLASFLKSYSSEFIKFALVGIGTTEGQLLADHASLSRQLVPVRVPAMHRPDLESIVERTVDYLLENGVEFSFTPQATKELARVASGFPWFVHLLGQEALVDAVDNGRPYADQRQVARAIATLPQRRLAKQFNDLYMRAVRDSSAREYVLRLFAEWGGEDIPTSEIYPRAHRLGVTGPSTYVGHLTQEQCGAVLSRSPQHGRLYRFSDEMFKTYVRMRGSLYRDVDKEVRSQFGR